MKMFAQESVTLLLFTEQVEDCALARYLMAVKRRFCCDKLHNALLDFIPSFWRYCLEVTPPPRSEWPRHAPDQRPCVVRVSG